MKTMGIQDTKLEECVREAQKQRVLLMRNGKPVALIVGVEGMDREQVELGHSDKLWALITERRAQKTITRAELERRLRRRPKAKSRHG
jgi:antitoxin (DNA-binding transcriptional repressor) of toxin-antitoxin stability system